MAERLTQTDDTSQGNTTAASDQTAQIAAQVAAERHANSAASSTQASSHKSDTMAEAGKIGEQRRGLYDARAREAAAARVRAEIEKMEPKVRLKWMGFGGGK